MDILFDVWLAFNIIFGLWTFRNFLVWARAIVFGVGYSQSQIGQIMDLVILTSCLSYILYFYF